ncbi:MAG: ABC transporter substrate-binding protein [Armatimonadota bacterium]
MRPVRLYQVFAGHPRRHHSPLLRSALMAAIAVALSASIGSVSAPAAAPAARPTGQLVIAVANTPVTVDPEFGGGASPASWEAMVATYDPLVFYQKKPGTSGQFALDFQQIEGRLAESWAVSDDKLTYTFRLRRNVKSAFGNEMTADDVKWSWDRGYELRATRLFLGTVAGLAGKDSVQVVNRYTVAFRLQQQSAVVLPTMTLYNTAIIDSTEAKKHAAADDPWARRWLQSNSAGFGAYQLESMTPGTHATFTANPNYYRSGLPQVGKVVYREVPDSGTRLSLLVFGGVVDIAEGLTPRELQQLTGRSGAKLVSHPGNAFVSAQMNVMRPPFDNPKVRQAVAYAAPYDAIRNEIYLGTLRPIKSIIPEVTPCYTDKYFPYRTDEARARALLSESGIRMPLQVPLTYSQALPEHEQVAQVLQTALRRVGIELLLDKVTPARYRELVNGKQALFYIAQGSSFVNDPGYNITLWYARGFAGAVNWTGYNNPRVEDLLARGASEADPRRRCASYDEIQKIILDDSPWVYLGVVDHSVGFRDRVQGYFWSPDNVMRLHELTKR